MRTIEAVKHGVVPGTQAAAALRELLHGLQGSTEETVLVFEKGDYHIRAQDCTQEMLYITNTVGDKEFGPGETPHLNAVPFFLKNIQNLTIRGGGARFILDGKATNMALQGCENIAVQDLEITATHPDMHALTVVGKGLFHTDFRLDADSQYSCRNGEYFFEGTGYSRSFFADRNTAFWIGLIRKDEPEAIRRVRHPFMGAVRICELEHGVFRVWFLNTSRFKMGDEYYIFDVRRQYAGIFVDRCKNVTLQNIKQRFNYSLALVAQDTDTLTAEGLTFAPEEDSVRRMASVADFIQICMCRGQVRIEDCLFSGAGDDCLNVHGIHFKIQRKAGNTITVRFMHAQSHGFNPLRAGDTVAFIRPDSMLEHGQAKILNSVLHGEYEIELTLDDAKDAVVGEVIEDISACPDVHFADNRLTRIITRGLLLTTRGKVVVENNRFVSTTMSGILLSDDAKSWYESGMCKNVTIRNNIFEYCGETPIRILPENAVHKGAVHENVTIQNNIFGRYPGKCITAKSTAHLRVSGNRFGKPGSQLQCRNCEDVKED